MSAGRLTQKKGLSPLNSLKKSKLGRGLVTKSIIYIVYCYLISLKKGLIPPTPRSAELTAEALIRGANKGQDLETKPLR